MMDPSARYRRLLSALLASNHVSKRRAHTLALHIADIADSCASIAQAVEQWSQSPKRTDLDSLLIDLLINVVHLKTHWVELGPLIEKRLGVKEEEVSPAETIGRTGPVRKRKG